MKSNLSIQELIAQLNYRPGPLTVAGYMERERAARELGDRREKSALNALIEAWEAEDILEVSRSIIRAIGQYHTTEARKFIIQRAKYGLTSCRAIALSALAQFDDDEVISVLTDESNSHENDIQNAATFSLKKIRDRRAAANNREGK